MYVRSPTDVPVKPSIWITPLTPLADEYWIASPVYWPLDVVAFSSATFVYVSSKTNNLQ